ncbi:MAG: polyprenol monophosphomannose synthase [Cytophagaceae bacterium]
MENAIVIVPTYNEKDNIEKVVRKVFSLSVPFHLLIIDDNSPDGTADIVKTLQQEFPDRLFLEQRTGKLGLGTAYIHGFKYAIRKAYEYICEMDADLSHNPEDLVSLYKACAEEGYDLSVGSRYVNGITVINWPMSRVLMSYFASKYVRFITGIPVQDTTAGFKCYKKKVLETLKLDEIKFVGYAFQIQMKFLTWKYGFKIKEVPIIFCDRVHGTSKMSSGIFKEAIFGVLQMKIKSWFENYNT